MGIRKERKEGRKRTTPKEVETGKERKEKTVTRKNSS